MSDSLQAKMMGQTQYDEEHIPSRPVSRPAPLDTDTIMEENDESYQEYDQMKQDEENLAELLRDALVEREQLTSINNNLQRKIIAFKDRDKKKKVDEKSSDKERESTSAGSAVATSDNMKTTYLQLLQEAFVLREKLKAKESAAQVELERLHSKFDVKSAQAAELRDYFRDFKREMAKGAVFPRSGQPIPAKRIFKFETDEEELESRVEEVRTKNLFLRNQLRKVERSVGEKERLADTGLALIDFEQLKIENQTLNEKIEERNDELHKLRKKTTATVQVLTHIKEKLMHVSAENSELASKLHEQDEDVQQIRDRLTKAKQARDALRASNATLKQQQGFVSSDLLVHDFESRKETIEKLQHELDLLQARHAHLTQTISQHKLSASSSVAFGSTASSPQHSHLRTGGSASRSRDVLARAGAASLSSSLSGRR